MISMIYVIQMIVLSRYFGTIWSQSISIQFDETFLIKYNIEVVSSSDLTPDG